MDEYQLGKDIERILHRLDAVERAGHKCNCERDEAIAAVSDNSIAIAKFSISVESYLLVVRMRASSPIEKGLRIPKGRNYYDASAGGERISVIFGSRNQPIKPGDLMTFAGLGDGRGWYKKQLRNFSCKKHNHDEDCCDMNSYFNTLDSLTTGSCSYKGTWTKRDDC